MKNIIYLHTHDSGRLLSPYGHAFPTPELDRLADEGILFRQAFCCCPTCSPSRSSLLTGLNPHSAGMMGLAHRGFRMSDYSKHLANYLRNFGYKTALCGIYHEISEDGKDLLGYEETLGALALEKSDDRGRAWIQRDKDNALAVAEFLRRPHDKPFFLSFGMFSTHRPFPANPSVNADRLSPPCGLPDTPVTRRDMAGFIEMAMAVDECVGTVIRALKDSGLADDTVVFFTTDHGPAFPFHKCTLADTGIGVALMFRMPGAFASGHTVDALVSHLDVFPTLCDIADLPKPDWLQGVSLLPLITGDAGKVRDEIFSEVNFHASYEPLRCVRTERYKLIRDFADGCTPLANIDNSPTKQLFLEAGLGTRKRPLVQLYDLVFDPSERQNLAESPHHAPVLKELSAKLHSWMLETEDPLLNSPLDPPIGAKLEPR